MTQSQIDSDSQRAITLHYAHAMADVLSQQGVDRAQLLKRARLQPQAGSNASTFISLSQYRAFLLEAKRITQDPALGLRIGKGLQFGHHGTFAFSALSFPDVWSAMKVGQKFAMLCNAIVEMQLAEAKDTKVIRVETAHFSGALYRTVIEIVMGMFCEQFKFMLGGAVSDLEIHLRFGEPDYADQYRESFDQRVVFEADANEIHIPQALATQSLPMADTKVAQRFEEECDQRLLQLQEEKAFAERVRDMLFLSKKPFPKLEDVAFRLNVSPRTLRRRLQQEGTSFRKTLEAVRLELAQRYLTETARSIGSIADLLGYEDQNSFSHAFKVSVGMPPMQYRRQFAIASP